MGLDKYEAATRLIRAATGDEHGDGMMVTDILVGYAEPGYGSILSDGPDLVVLGNWNDRRSRWDAERSGIPLTNADTVASRLGDALERIGVEIEWSDEWHRCDECFRAVRSKSDSYHWKPSYVQHDDGIACHECALKYPEGFVADYVNDSDRCVTWCEPADLKGLGFVKWEPGDEHTYENGWHPGQTDVPEPIMGAIHERHPEAEVVFFLDEASQFYIRFSAYFRIPEEGDDD